MDDGSCNVVFHKERKQFVVQHQRIGIISGNDLFSDRGKNAEGRFIGVLQSHCCRELLNAVGKFIETESGRSCHGHRKLIEPFKPGISIDDHNIRCGMIRNVKVDFCFRNIGTSLNHHPAAPMLAARQSCTGIDHDPSAGMLFHIFHHRTVQNRQDAQRIDLDIFDRSTFAHNNSAVAAAGDNAVNSST